MVNTLTAERTRIKENEKKEIPIALWGPYLSERQWGTVREDYSPGGDVWNYFPHDHARSRVYRWGEDGLGGISDLKQQLCFAIALWNGKDPILKERLFGLSNPEGNHGEDVKELYYHLDNIPTHYYMKFLYKYPQQAYPYVDLVDTNKARGKDEPEYEILDTGVFNDDRYFDVYIEYAKQNEADIFIKIEMVNRGPEKAPLTLLPVLWFYNFWQYSGEENKPSISFFTDGCVKAVHPLLKEYFLYFQPAGDVLFTENETNFERLFQVPNKTAFVKDAFHEAIIHGTNLQELKEKRSGTKCAPVYHFEIEGGASSSVYLRLTNVLQQDPFSPGFEQIFSVRKKEADDFYRSILPPSCTADEKNILRQAFAGLLWNKQYYHYDVDRWLHTSDGITPVNEERKKGRNHSWKYLKNQDILSMPDSWEYPWYAAWDTAFHCITLAMIDPTFAKHQLTLLMREWYMNPHGQLPAYEWDFNDVNPPVHAFAALQVYKTEAALYGKKDIVFLKSIFEKLIINFTWWINRKDADGNSIFEGGFLGLDNIGLFNRSTILPGNTLLEQADGTSWMGMYALDMMNMALEIAVNDIAFEDTATKFYEHFVIIAEALNELGLWDEEDKFFYDALSLNKSTSFPLKVRSVIGLTSLYAVTVVEKEVFDRLPDFTKRMQWFQNYRIANSLYLPTQEQQEGKNILFSLVNKERLQELCTKMLDEKEFLSAGGIRALSKFYQDNPYTLEYGGRQYAIQYDPGDATSGIFGGNSNWRGPVWIPVNYLLIHAFQTFGSFYGKEIKVACPAGSGKLLTFSEVAKELSRRILHIFKMNEAGERVIFGKYSWFYQKEENRGLLLFNEYFHGDTLMGLGASHQTGWTALIVNLLFDLYRDPVE